MLNKAEITKEKDASYLEHCTWSPAAECGISFKLSFSRSVSTQIIMLNERCSIHAYKEYSVSTFSAKFIT